MTAEQEVDFAAIRVGDKVKIRYHGLESPDWHEVVRGYEGCGGFRVGDGWWIVGDGEVAVIAHQPAPRKVEVTLGKPLDSADRFYAGWVAASRAQDGPGVYLNTEGPAHLPPPEARRLVRDILATVGVDD